jgi:hypothetical protein
VVATDGAGNSTEQAVTLDINDLDESAPTFTSGATASVDENSGADEFGQPVGQVVYTAQADDLPIDPEDENSVVSGNIAYSLGEFSDAALSIDAASGAVSLNVVPDYETQSEYSFTVIATDGAGNSSSQAVTLYINNLDDTAPTFTSDVAVSVDENSGSGQVIYTTTTDDSNDVSDGVTYSFAVGDDSALTINAVTGGMLLEPTQITVPDVVANTQHVYVSASTLSVESGTQEITVSYNAANTVTGLGLKVHYDSSVLTLSEITDFLTDADSGAQFVIEPTVEDAEVDTDNADNNEDTDMFVNMSWAVFGGSTWPNNGLPADLLTMTFDISEGATENTVIGFSATSTGAGYVFDGQDQDLTLVEVNEDDPTLSIDSATGEVILSVDPNYEEQNQYDFNVAATDAAGNSSDQAVTVTVNDVDEIAPVINSADSNVVVENSSPIIYTATAVDTADADLAPTDPENITFAMDSVMSISHQNSLVSQKVTQNEDGSYKFILSLVDNYIDHLPEGTTTIPDSLDFTITYDSSQLELHTAIGDDGQPTDELLVDDITGWFTLANISGDGEASIGTLDSQGVFDPEDPAGIPEDKFIVSFDFSVIGYSDSSIQIDTMYMDNEELVPDISTAINFDDSLLDMNASSGEVSVVSGPDYEAQADYYFSVTAIDEAGNTSEAQAVAVNINNVDEAAPVINSEAAVVAVTADQSNPVIYSATAIDSADDLVSGNITYSLVDNTDYSAVASPYPSSTINVPDVVASTQHVYVSSSTKSADGSQETMVVSYSADDGNLLGLGIRVHYDSSRLTLSDISDVLPKHLFIDPENLSVEEDADDSDQNPDTDMLFLASWAKFSPGSGDWPGTTSADLFTMTFDIAEGATENAAIGFSSSSTTAGYSFSGQTHEVAIGESDPVESKLSIDNTTGVVTLDAEFDYTAVPNYSFTVTATDAANNSSDLDVVVASQAVNANGSQIVPLVVADQVVDADVSSYTGTAEADVFALADGSAEITSDAGADVFVLDPAFASAAHTITDFESGVDSFDISAAFVAAGYTADNAPTQLISANMSADILDLVNGDDSSLDNLFGATYDDASNTLTVFADSDSSVGATDMDSFQITLDDNATVDDDDVIVNLNAFIA